MVKRIETNNVVYTLSSAKDDSKSFLCEKIQEKLKENSWHCPCMVIKNDDTLCPCKESRENLKCRCGLYNIEKI